MIKRLPSYLPMLPSVVYGATGGGEEYTFSFIQKLLCNVVNLIFTISLIVGIVFILFAAYTYISSGGNEEKVSQANKSMLYAAIGILVAIVAAGVPSLIANFVGQSISNTCP